MFEKPEKTNQLLATLQAALPFEVGLATPLIVQLAQQQTLVAVKPKEMASEVSNPGDEAGIVCHIRPQDAESLVVNSLMHVSVHRSRCRQQAPHKAGCAVRYRR